MKMIEDIIIKPVITEASMDMLADENHKKYVFKVQKNATKPEIAAAVEQMFKVEVAEVNTINMKRKPKRLRYQSGHTSAWTKAIVTLKADSKTIEFFEGMN